MSHPKLLKTRARAAGVATLAAASLLLTSFTPFNGSVAADNTSASETTQATSASETENTSDASASASEQTAASNTETPVAGGTEANTWIPPLRTQVLLQRRTSLVHVVHVRPARSRQLWQ